MTSQILCVLETPIFHKMYDLYRLIESYHCKIPKHQRYTLWEKCENTTLGLIETLIATSHRKGEDRVTALYHISNKLDLLKVLFRLAKDTRAIDSLQYVEIQKIVREIGKMIGGWIKSVPHRS